MAAPLATPACAYLRAGRRARRTKPLRSHLATAGVSPIVMGRRMGMSALLARNASARLEPPPVSVRSIQDADLFGSALAVSSYDFSEGR